MPIDPNRTGPAADSILTQLLGPVNRVLERVPKAPTDVSNYMRNPENATPTQVGVSGILGALQAMGGGPGIRRPPLISQVTTRKRIRDWLDEAGVSSRLHSSRSGDTDYIQATHPLSNEMVTIRIPMQDRHYGAPLEIGDRRQIGGNTVSISGGSDIGSANRQGSYFDTGRDIINTNRPPSPHNIGNTRGNPYHDIEDSLLPALASRLSTAPQSWRGGNWLVEPGQQPHLPMTRDTPIPMTRPTGDMTMWGTQFRREPPPGAYGRPNNPNNNGKSKKISLPPRRPQQLELFR